MNGEGTIEAREIRKSFGSHLVLAGIDLTVAAGEITCIIGPSGSGKSTLLRCINGLETVDSGVLRVNGEDLGFRETPSAYIALSHAALARQRQHIGMVFQGFNLFPHMTAAENVMAGPVLVKDTAKAAAMEQAACLLASVGLAGFDATTPRSCPVGRNNASRSVGRWPWNPASCSSTNPPARSTRNGSVRCSGS